MVTAHQIFAPVETDLQLLNDNLRNMIGARHPILYAASEHLFTAGGKRLRPAIILLCAKASNINHSIHPAQRRLAELTEIIHTASLVHDDVLDECTSRRGTETVHYAFSTKVAILAGDFLFAQSSWYLANLGNLEVVKIMSKVITDFAEGEVRQGFIRFNLKFSVKEYIAKSFYKTGSLIASGCQGAAILSPVSPTIAQQFYLYGRYLGLAFQIIDDVLDIVASSQDLGKPTGADMAQGNLTAPILLSLPEQPKLALLISREFSNNGDLEETLYILKNSTGIEQAKDMASEYLQSAINCLQNLPDSDVKTRLQQLTVYILERMY